MNVMQNQALFILLGNQYGGDGRTNFNLPDLRGRVAIHRGTNSSITYQQGKSGGAEGVALTASNIPTHIHQFNVSSSPATSLNVGASKNHLLAQSNLYNAADPSIQGPGKPLYAAASNLTPLEGAMCDNTGGSVAHNNMQPSLVLNYIIALEGIYPPRS
jgi:microcystin-dependent protein